MFRREICTNGVELGSKQVRHCGRRAERDVENLRKGMRNIMNRLLPPVVEFIIA